MHLMQTAFIYYAVFSMVEGAIGFNQRCPRSNEWHFRRKNCTSPDKPFYACLYNEFSLQYSENCTRKEYESRKGKKVVFSPAVSETDCADSRFQPIKFTTLSFSDCINAKSTCSEEGQVLAKNGSSFVDRSCRCDYRKGYDYVIQPKDKCSCVPSLEDCSCYLTHCTGHSALTQDYDCVLKIDSRSGSIVCGKILNGSPVNVTTSTKNSFVEKKELSSTSAFKASIIVLMFVTFVLILMWVLLKIYVLPHAKETNGTSEKYNIIYIKHGTPKTYHIIEGENFTIKCEIRSRLLFKSVRWQKGGHDINLEADKYKLNDSKLSLTIENVSEVDGGTYTCIVSNSYVSFVSALLKRMKWDWASNHFQEYRKENQNSMAVNVHKLPSKYEVEEKQKGDEVTMKPSLLFSEDVKKVRWFFKNEDILRDIKLDQLDTNNDTAKPDHPGLKCGGRTMKNPKLVFKTNVSDNGHYICFVVVGEGSIKSFRWKLRVIPQEETYVAVLEHRKDKTYVKTSTVDMAVECLKNNGLVVIVGRKGTGKSKMCLQLESVFLEEDYLPIRFDNISDRREIADLESTKIIFSLDHITSLDHKLDLLPEVLGNSKAKVICTCSHVEMATVNEILQAKELYSDKAVIDLDDNIPSLEEKKKILEGFSASMSSKLDVDLFNTIIKTEPFFGFPLKAKKFCSIKKHFQKGEKYFTYPPKSLRKEICDLYKTSIETKKPDLMNEYCVLAYIATDKNHCLDLSNIDLKRYMVLKKMIYNDTENESKFKDVVDTLVWKYLVITDNYTYRFIHPAVSKAVFLSSDHFTNYIIEEGDIEDIIEFIRSVKYAVSVDDLVLKLENNEPYNLLCERLAIALIEQPDLVKNIGDYIYHNFIKMRDSDFLMVLFHKLGTYFSFGKEKQNQISEKNERKEKKKKVNEENTDTNVNQMDKGNEDISKTMISHLLPFTMIPLIEHLTRTGIDMWIYSNEDIAVPDCIVLYGLIMACKNTFHRNEDKSKTFEAIFKLFCKKCQEEHFLLDICKPMDIYGNVFCHYLTMFSESESFSILTALLNFLPKLSTMEKIKRSKEGKLPYKVKNMLQESPMQMSAYLGKAKIFKILWAQSKDQENKRKHLWKTAEIGMRFSHGIGSSTSEIKSFLYLDNDMSQLVLRGEKEGYTEIIGILQKTERIMTQKKVKV